MSSFKIRAVSENPFPIVAIEGYFAKAAGLQLKECLEVLLARTQAGVVLDFSGCAVISSPGVAALLDVVMYVTDDIQVPCILTGLDRSKADFLEMTGILTIAGTAPTPDAAVKRLST